MSVVEFVCGRIRRRLKVTMPGEDDGCKALAGRLWLVSSDR